MAAAAAARADVYAATKAGERLAEQHCVVCHATGSAKEAPRHDRTPSLRELAPAIEADRERYRLFLTNPHREMTGVSLDRAEIEALLDYMVSLPAAP
jgi:mono/diheme cytochrome c family protein